MSAEWLRTTATGIPILLLAYWVLRGQAWLWRRWIWTEIGAVIAAHGQRPGARIRPLRTGWRVEADGRRIDWIGGLQGPRTIIDGVARPDWVDPDT